MKEQAKTTTKFDKREAELRVLLALARHVVRSDDLHFGYWPADLPVNLCNLPRAQQHHSELILEHIPKAAQTVLDVGCGVGRMAARLLSRGHAVEGVTPSALLAAETRKLLGDEFCVHECRFEDFAAEKHYDLLLFSESFQYLQVEAALEKSVRLLPQGGHLLICDFFRKDAVGDSPLNAGPSLAQFRALAAARPLELCIDLDITAQTAPTLDLADEILTRVVSPAWEILLESLRVKQPALSWLLRRVLRRKIERLEWRYLRGAFTAANFERYKSYRLLLFRKTAARAA